jgi:hypothetical protein
MGKKLKSLRSKIEELREDLAELWKAVHGKAKPGKPDKTKKKDKKAKAGKSKKAKAASAPKSSGKPPAKKAPLTAQKSGSTPTSVTTPKPVRPAPQPSMLASHHSSAPPMTSHGDDE